MAEAPVGDKRFHDLLKEIGDLHDKKQRDYGRTEDPFANVRASSDWGVPAWVGALIRGTDKIKRLQKAARGGTLSNEGVEDSMMDLAVYALISLILYREEEDGYSRLGEGTTTGPSGADFWGHTYYICPDCKDHPVPYDQDDDITQAAQNYTNG